MIYYDTEKFFQILTQWKGSPLKGSGPKRAFTVAVFSLILAVVNYYFKLIQNTRESTAFVDTLTVSNTFMGLLISFRLNSAFQQWRNGVLAITAVGQAARNLMSTACAFVDLVGLSSCQQEESVLRTIKYNNSHRLSLEDDNRIESKKSDEEKNLETQDDNNRKLKFLTDLRRLVLLYIHLIFHDCRNNSDLSDTKMLSEEELAELKINGAGYSNAGHQQSVASKTPNKLRAAIVELWLRRLVQDGKYSGYFTPPEANGLNSSISQLPILFTNVSNIAHIPIPFNYAQYLEICIVFYMVLYSCVIVPRSELYTPIWVFLWGLILFVANDVATEIECPFGTDDNDIDLEARLMRIEDELTVLLKSQYHFGGLTCKKKNEKKYPKSAPHLNNSFVSLSVSSSPTNSADLHTRSRSADFDDKSPKPPASESVLDLPMMRTSNEFLKNTHSAPTIDEYTPLMLNRLDSQYLTEEGKMESRQSLLSDGSVVSQNDTMQQS